MSERALQTKSMSRSVRRELATFVLVGACAFGVHFLTVITLASSGVHPLVANVAGFALAFGVSFAGHNRWTFRSRHHLVSPALLRFLIIGLSGFLCNETLYWLLITYTSLDYRQSLVIVLSLIAVLTYLAGKHWAFIQHGD